MYAMNRLVGWLLVASAATLCGRLSAGEPGVIQNDYTGVCSRFEWTSPSIPGRVFKCYDSFRLALLPKDGFQFMSSYQSSGDTVFFFIHGHGVFLDSNRSSIDYLVSDIRLQFNSTKPDTFKATGLCKGDVVDEKLFVVCKVKSVEPNVSFTIEWAFSGSKDGD